MLDECLEQDLKWGKVMRLCKQDQDKAALKECLRKHYLDIKNMFLLMASNSNYPTIGANDYNTFIQRSNLMDKHLTLANVDI